MSGSTQPQTLPVRRMLKSVCLLSKCWLKSMHLSALCPLAVLSKDGSNAGPSLFERHASGGGAGGGLGGGGAGRETLELNAAFSRLT